MQVTDAHNQKIEKLLFSQIYPLYLAKIEKKGRNKQELNTVITWLTGFTELKINSFVENTISFKEFFEQANLNQNTHLITGKICGYDVQTIENKLTQQVRFLDKLVDELAKGWTLNKIMRK